MADNKKIIDLFGDLSDSEIERFLLDSGDTDLETLELLGDDELLAEHLEEELIVDELIVDELLIDDNLLIDDTLVVAKTVAKTVAKLDDGLIHDDMLIHDDLSPATDLAIETEDDFLIHDDLVLPDTAKTTPVAATPAKVASPNLTAVSAKSAKVTAVQVTAASIKPAQPATAKTADVAVSKPAVNRISSDAVSSNAVSSDAAAAHPDPDPAPAKSAFDTRVDTIAHTMQDFKTQLKAIAEMSDAFHDTSSQLMAAIRELEKDEADDFSITYEQAYQLRGSLLAARRAFNEVPNFYDLVEQAWEYDLYTAQMRHKHQTGQ